MRKLAGSYHRDRTRGELGKGREDTIAFSADNCVETALGFCLKLKGEERRDKKNNILEDKLQFMLKMDRDLIHGYF